VTQALLGIYRLKLREHEGEKPPPCDGCQTLDAVYCVWPVRLPSRPGFRGPQVCEGCKPGGVRYWMYRSDPIKGAGARRSVYPLMKATPDKLLAALVQGVSK
jgi:hypothetical protein